MAKGICSDGVSVDQKVRSFQLTRNNDDFLLVKQYYDNYKDRWYKQVEGIMDHEEFYSKWCGKLLKSMNNYCEEKAIKLSRSKGWSMNQKFNRWFWRAVFNLVSNIITQHNQLKNYPGIVCPVCFKEVKKIESKHLSHVRTTKDLPKIFQYDGCVYKVMLKPRKEARIYTCGLQEALKNPKCQTKGIPWPWKINGSPGVVCPFTKKIVEIIDNEYLSKLPRKYRYYAKPYTWFEFQNEFPNSMVRSEIMSLEFSDESDKKDQAFIDQVLAKKRLKGDFASYTCSYLNLGRRSESSPVEYEHAIKSIEKHVEDKTDKKILKYLMIGYELPDICEELNISRKEIKVRTALLQKNKSLEKTLLYGII